jgi:hypothetical protein
LHKKSILHKSWEEIFINIGLLIIIREEDKMKNIYPILIVGFLVLSGLEAVGIPNEKLNSINSEIPAEEEGGSKFGIVIGPIQSKTYDEDILELVVGQQIIPWYAFGFSFYSLFNSRKLIKNQQIRLTQYNKCYFIEDFVVGFCKIYMPKAEISMHIASHNEQENEIIWEVDEIIGDKIWERNMRPSVYTDSGDEFSFAYGPAHNEYLSVGDQIGVNTHIDGYFRLVIKEVVSRDILFESGLVKF